MSDVQVKRALIYNRVSSDPSGRAISVASQDTENRAFCERQGWTVVGTVTDNDRSASRHATRPRDGYTEVRRAMAARELDVLVCWEASRGERDLEVYVQLRRLCADNAVLWAYSGRVHDLTRTDDRFNTGLDVLLAEREADVTRDRIRRAVRTAAAQGQPHGTLPYGYRRVYDDRTGALIEQVPDEATAPIVAGIVSRVIDGRTLYSIVADLNERGVPTPQAVKDRLRGKDERRLWSSSTVRALLRTPTIAGVRSHLGVETPARWEPIVSEAEYRLACAILADPVRARNHAGTRARHLLSGIGTCGPCGAWLRPANNRGRPVYQCAGHGVGHPAGKAHVSRPRAPIEALVVRHVIGRLGDPGLLAEYARRHDAHRRRGVDLAGEVAALQADLDAHVRAAGMRSGVARAAFERVVDDLAGQIERKQAELSAAARLPAEVQEAAGPDAAAVWDDHRDDIGWQRTVVRFLVRVRLDRSTLPHGVRRFDQHSVAITDR